MSDLTLVGGTGLLDPSGKAIPPSEYPNIRVPVVRIVGPRLLVKVATPVEGATKSGIIIPDSAKDTTQRAVVVVTGEGTLLPDGSVLEPCCEVGDEIIFARYSGTEIELEDDKFLIIQESDVRAVLTYRGKIFSLAEEDLAAMEAERKRRRRAVD